MNLVLSLQAAYAAPIIMMSQNRQDARDRLEAKNDYEVNRKAEEEIRAILDRLAAQNEALRDIHDHVVGVRRSRRRRPRETTAVPGGTVASPVEVSAFSVATLRASAVQ